MSCKGNRVDRVLEDKPTPRWRLKAMENIDEYRCSWDSRGAISFEKLISDGERGGR